MSQTKPDGFDDQLWDSLTERQRTHLLGAVDSDLNTLLDGESMTPLHTTVYSQCWQAMKRDLFANGILKREISLEEIVTLERYCLATLMQTMNAIMIRQQNERN